MSEMNVGAELNKLQRISEQAALVIALHRESLDDPDFDVFAVIKQIKQEILELLMPCDIHVVYKQLKVYQGGLKQEPVGFYLFEHVADDIQDRMFDNNEDKNLEFFVEKEELQ